MEQMKGGNSEIGDNEVDLGSVLGAGGSGRKFQRDIEPNVEDVPLIQCEACKQMVKRLVRRAKARREALKKSKFAEHDVLDMMQHICDPLHEEGEWITEYDIQEEGDRLKLARQPSPGVCKEECKTIGLACDRVQKQFDSEIAERVFLGKGDDPDVVCSQVVSLSLIHI